MRRIGVCLLIVSLALAACSRVSHKAAAPRKLDGSDVKALSFQAHAPSPGPATRAAYRFSVIKGGVFSSSELASARRTDPIVRAHYAPFGKNVVFRVTTQDLYAYVSYRKNNCIYWSRTKHRIPKGELLLTDGEHLARTRCGNQLAESSQNPTAPAEHEPTEAELNTSEAVTLPDVEMSSIPGVDFYMPADSLPSPSDLAPWSDAGNTGALHNASLSSASTGAASGYGAQPISGYPTGAIPGFGPGEAFFFPVATPVPLGETPEPGSAELLFCVLSIALLVLLFRKRVRPN